MSKDRRASLIRTAANTPQSVETARRLALLEAQVKVLTKALAAKSYDLTIGFLLRSCESQIEGSGKTQREKRLIREKLEHGNCFCFVRGNEHKIVEADCLEDAWTKVRMTEGWSGDDVACLGDTLQGPGLYAA